jgi:two-component system alkaline phosphatase synthesis response regulator PhoP
MSPALERPPRILIAEDTPHSAELMEEYLSETEAEVRIASDGEIAMREATAWQPDLILLDVMMPRLTGFDVCKRLRANTATREIGIIMITALDQPSDVERAVEAGTDDFLSKPINKAELLKRVRALLDSRRHPRELDRALAYIEGVQKGDAAQP